MGALLALLSALGPAELQPRTPDQIWLDEFLAARPRRPAVLRATQAASKVLNELIAVHLADPNMYIWPEINPGGLLDSYKEVRPSDFRTVSSFDETARNRLHAVASAKQTALQTAERFHAWALQTEQAIEEAQAALGDSHREWLSTKPDLQVLALLARFHGRRQMAADHLAWFEATSDSTALFAARREAGGALRSWQDLVKLTTGLYPSNMAFGPADTGHWKDKLPYLEHDLKSLDERLALLAKYGPVRLAFDFGAPVQPARPSYRQTAQVLANTVRPGFRPVSPDSMFAAAAGYGWLAAEPRQATALPLTPYAEIRGVSANPAHLPAHVLLGDFISGSGPQLFRVLLPDGDYRVTLLHPDGSDQALPLTASGGSLDLPMPQADWRISGLLIQGGPGSAIRRTLAPPSRPSFHRTQGPRLRHRCQAPRPHPPRLADH